MAAILALPFCRHKRSWATNSIADAYSKGFLARFGLAGCWASRATVRSRFALLPLMSGSPSGSASRQRGMRSPSPATLPSMLSLLSSVLAGSPAMLRAWPRGNRIPDAPGGALSEAAGSEGPPERFWTAIIPPPPKSQAKSEKTSVERAAGTAAGHFRPTCGSKRTVGACRSSDKT